MQKAIKLDSRDNVAVALNDIPANSTVHVENQEYYLKEPVQAKHKFVLNDLNTDDSIIMYGIVVGRTLYPISTGTQITTQNVKHRTQAYSVTNKTEYSWHKPDIQKWKNRTFKGYHRADGQVGTLNYWLVIPLVFCENYNIQKLQKIFDKALGYSKPDIYQEQIDDLVKLYKNGQSDEIDNYTKNPITHEELRQNYLFPNIDGVKFINHVLGCGGSNQDSAMLSKLFAAMANNPNVAGITVLSLGCQKTQFSDLTRDISQINSQFAKPILFFEQQKYGTEYAMMSAAIKATFKGLIEANKLTRSDAPLTKLTIGLKCGGSDGFSGISANPTLGVLSDILASIGGSTILAEFPELCGVEQELINRSTSVDIASKFVHLMEDYAAKARAVGSGFDMNPSVGNIKDGLITDAIKSAGAAKKGGTAPINDVLDYTETVKTPGLNLLCTPGNDVIATTAMAASGANIILFTTGLGTPTGNPICPVVKVSSNSEVAKKMPDVIDFDCGAIIKGTKTIYESAEDLLEYCIDLASGKIKAKAQILEHDDFIPWQRGINL